LEVLPHVFMSNNLTQKLSMLALAGCYLIAGNSSALSVPLLFPNQQDTAAREITVLEQAESLSKNFAISRDELEFQRQQMAMALYDSGSSNEAIEVLETFIADPPMITHSEVLCKHPEEIHSYPYDLIAKNAIRQIKIRMLAKDVKSDKSKADIALKELEKNSEITALAFLNSLDSFDDGFLRQIYKDLQNKELTSNVEGTRLFLAVCFKLGIQPDAGNLSDVVLWEYFPKLDRAFDSEKDFLFKIYRKRADFESALEWREKSENHVSIKANVEKGSVVNTYTESRFGFPIPEPIDSETPVVGFRSYDSLVARYSNLANSNATITRTQTGTSIDQRPIYSFEFLKDGFTNTPEGIEKGVIVFEGGIHAREWAAHESMANIFEYFALEENDDTLADYILDQINLVIHPLANPDGILQTQRYFDMVVGTSSNPNETGGRDGRNRRKNLNGVDEDLFTTDDASLGVDLNRNFANGWSGGFQTSITYGGTAPLSEPESNALIAATDLINTDRFRLFIDFHSFGPGYYVCRDFDFSSDYDDSSIALTNLMNQATFDTTGLSNSLLLLTDFSENSNQGFDPIGATEESLALLHGCLAFTAEVRNAVTGSPNGFVLPADEVPDVKAEQLASTQVAMYHMAGPATPVAFEVYDMDNNLLIEENYTYSPNLELRVSNRYTTGPVNLLLNNNYQLVVRFNKPIRLYDGQSFEDLDGARSEAITANLSGLNLGTGTYLRNTDQITPLQYEGDSILFNFSPNQVQDYNLTITGEDASELAIDQNPETVADWSRQGWINFEQAPENLFMISAEDFSVSNGDLLIID